ncbi:hypothetical protein M0804_015374 [Polistes exclamans]|nr:hypothetical protein M0804_015374 [Polistes exclamans]
MNGGMRKGEWGWDPVLVTKDKDITEEKGFLWSCRETITTSTVAGDTGTSTNGGWCWYWYWYRLCFEEHISLSLSLSLSLLVAKAGRFQRLHVPEDSQTERILTVPTTSVVLVAN